MTSEHRISPAFVFWSGTTCRKNANPARKLAKNKNSIRKTRVLTRQVCLPCFSLSTAKDQRRNFWSNKVTLFILLLHKLDFKTSSSKLAQRLSYTMSHACTGVFPTCPLGRNMFFSHSERPELFYSAHLCRNGFSCSPEQRICSQLSWLNGKLNDLDPFKPSSHYRRKLSDNFDPFKPSSH